MEKLDIFTDNLLPDFGYRVQLQGPRTFEDMVMQAIRIEEFMVKKGELTLHKDTRHGSTSVKDKSKYANKNREIVHDGVVDNITPKPAKVAFNLIDNLKASRQAEKSLSDKQASRNRPRNSWATRPKREFTPLGEPLYVVYQTLLQHKILSPLDNTRPYNPHPHPLWWNETSYCEYHQNKGHKLLNCVNLCHKIQNLIDNGDIVVDGHNTNADHKAFKEPFPTYDKGESSTPL